MEQNKLTAEEYLKECIQGEGANEVVSYAESLYAIQLKEEELLSSLCDQDVEEYIYKQSAVAIRMPSHNSVITIDDANYALSIQSAKHKKEMEDLKENAEDCFYETLCFVNEHPDINSLTIVDIVKIFKQQLNSK